MREDIARLAEQLARTGQHSYGNTARRAAVEAVEQAQGGGADGDRGAEDQCPRHRGATDDGGAREAGRPPLATSRGRRPFPRPSCRAALAGVYRERGAHFGTVPVWRPERRWQRCARRSSAAIAYLLAGLLASSSASSSAGGGHDLQAARRYGADRERRSASGRRSCWLAIVIVFVHRDRRGCVAAGACGTAAQPRFHPKAASSLPVSPSLQPC